MENKLRVWWIPQVPMKSFHVPVKTVEEGKKVMDMLAAYDEWQYENNIKPDFSNVGGIQMWDEEEQDWIDWYLETDDDYFEDVDEYCKQSEMADELKEFNRELFSQVTFEM